jgi:predicted RNA-binding Zn-ribbon protein involved in translation (DUF1610 family)
MFYRFINDKIYKNLKINLYTKEVPFMFIIPRDFYRLEERPDGRWRVQANVTYTCPDCGTDVTMKKNGTKERHFLDENNKQQILIINRFKCPKCERGHHQLPDIIFPYKQHCVVTIQKTIDDYPPPFVDFSTVRYINKWYLDCEVIIKNKCSDLIILFDHHDVDSVLDVQQLRTKFKSDWLARVVKILVISRNWPCKCPNNLSGPQFALWKLTFCRYSSQSQKRLRI